jgi:hypothetical protein
MAQRKGRRLTPEFKAKAVRLVREVGESLLRWLPSARVPLLLLRCQLRTVKACWSRVSGPLILLNLRVSEESTRLSAPLDRPTLMLAVHRVHPS